MKIELLLISSDHLPVFIHFFILPLVNSDQSSLLSREGTLSCITPPYFHWSFRKSERTPLTNPVRAIQGRREGTEHFKWLPFPSFASQSQFHMNYLPLLLLSTLIYHVAAQGTEWDTVYRLIYRTRRLWLSWVVLVWSGRLLIGRM